LAWGAIAAAVTGVLSTWTTDGPVHLGAVEGPNNGWLVLIAAGLALGWTRSMLRGSWIGIVGVFGASIVIGWTAIANWLDSRAVLAARASYGLVLVVLASLALAGTAVASGVERVHRHRNG
jgi:hypothetical protein